VAKVAAVQKIIDDAVEALAAIDAQIAELDQQRQTLVDLRAGVARALAAVGGMAPPRKRRVEVLAKGPPSSRRQRTVLRSPTIIAALVAWARDGGDVVGYEELERWGMSYSSARNMTTRMIQKGYVEFISPGQFRLTDLTMRLYGPGAEEP